jgi:hypothetical protein
MNSWFKDVVFKGVTCNIESYLLLELLSKLAECDVKNIEVGFGSIQENKESGDYTFNMNFKIKEKAKKDEQVNEESEEHINKKLKLLKELASEFNIFGNQLFVKKAISELENIIREKMTGEQ